MVYMVKLHRLMWDRGSNILYYLHGKTELLILFAVGLEKISD